MLNSHELWECTISLGKFAHSEKYFWLTKDVFMSGLGDSFILMIKICFESLLWSICEIFLAFYNNRINLAKVSNVLCNMIRLLWNYVCGAEEYIAQKLKLVF